MRELIKKWYYKIKEINQKYATPRIKMTRTTRIAMFMLRVYLLVLVSILIYKFITILRPAV